MPHPIYTLIAMFLLSMALAAVEDRSPRERLYAAARVFSCCAIATLAGSWVMRLIHG